MPDEHEQRLRRRAERGLAPRPDRRARPAQVHPRGARTDPAGPRCKLCAAPLKAPGSVLLRPFGFGPSGLNRRLCRACFRSMGKKPGGAEIELSLLFADVRGSTGLAEHIPAQEFSRRRRLRLHGRRRRGEHDGASRLVGGSGRDPRQHVSTSAVEAAGLDAGDLEKRTLELRGRGESVDAVVATA